MMKTTPKRVQIARKSWRNRQRGAVIVEGLIVAVMMVGVLLGTLFMRKVYSGKLLTITASRAEAWKYALSGCDDGGKQASLYSVIHEQSKDPANAICKDPQNCQDGKVDGLADDGSSLPPPDWFPSGIANGAMKQITVSSDHYTRTLSTGHRFSCNEKPAPELKLGSTDLLGAVAGVVRKLLDESVQPDETAKVCQARRFWGAKWKTHKCKDFGTTVDFGDQFHRRRDLDLDPPPLGDQK